MINIELALIGYALYVLIWEKLPEWGQWFNWIIARLPAPLAYLYEAWRCPYCFGFWAALSAYFLTGIHTMPSLFVEPTNIWLTSIYIFLDALVTALIILIMKLAQSAIAGPAIKGHQLTEEFKRKMKDSSQ